jgi:hypothetical protein
MWRDVLRRLENHFDLRGLSNQPPSAPATELELPSGHQLPEIREPQGLARSAVRVIPPDAPDAPAGESPDEAPHEAAVDRAPDRESAEPEAASRPVAVEPSPERGGDRDGDHDAEPTGKGSLRRTRVLGVNISEGVAYCAVVDASGTPLFDLADRVVPPRADDDAARLAGFAAEIGKMLARTDVGVIAVGRPERYTNWTYKDAFGRVSLETCIALEAHARGIRYESVGLNHAANVIGLPLARVSELMGTRLGIQKTQAWPDRWPALLVALATRAV